MSATDADADAPGEGAAGAELYAATRAGLAPAPTRTPGGSWQDLGLTEARPRAAADGGLELSPPMAPTAEEPASEQAFYF